MTITRADIMSEIWQRLNKLATTKGFYTESKVNSAIRECLDYISTHMFIANDGFTNKMTFLDTYSGQTLVPLAGDMAMINAVRYLVGDSYIPIMRDQDAEKPDWSSSSAAMQYPVRYRLVENGLYFNPPLGTGGEKYLQVEYSAYPKIMRNNNDTVDAQFDRSMFWFCIWRSCSVLASEIGQFQKPWAEHEHQWFSQMQQIIFKRVNQAIPIREYQGG